MNLKRNMLQRGMGLACGAGAGAVTRYVTKKGHVKPLAIVVGALVGAVAAPDGPLAEAAKGAFTVGVAEWLTGDGGMVAGAGDSPFELEGPEYIAALPPAYETDAIGWGAKCNGHDGAVFGPYANDPGEGEDADLAGYEDENEPAMGAAAAADDDDIIGDAEDDLED